MVFHLTAESTLLLIATLAPTLADSGLLPAQTHIEPSAAHLHDQILDYQRLLESDTPSLTPAGESSGLSLSENDAELSRNLELASQRLAAQQSMVSAQLEEVDANAHNVLRGLRLRQAASSGVPRSTSMLSVDQQQQRQMQRPKEQLALPQTISQLWRQRNPAVAALFLEPVLYGYSMLVWAAIVLLTGMSSAFCYFAGSKLPLRRSGTQQPADNARIGEPQPTEPPQSATSNRLGQFFRYPGSFFRRPVALGGERALEEGVEREEEAVENWIKVPAELAVRSRRQEVWRPQASTTEQGYLDDESDGEADPCLRPPPSHHQPHGYVDEY